MDRLYLEDLVQRLSIATGELSGVQNSLIARKIDLVEVAESARRIKDNHSSVRNALTKLQIKAQKSQIEGIESVLTDAINIVFDGFKDKVKLELKVMRNIPSLEIYMETEQGDRESVVDSRGGSLANVMAAAIPFIGISRSGNRPFIVLDEPDCWIAPSLIRPFFKMLKALSEKLGMQVLIVTHHEPELFKDIARVININSQDSSSLAGGGTHNPSTIKTLVFKNIGKISTCKIELSEGLTVIRGGNESGKSTLFSCLKSVMYQESASKFITHGCESGAVELELGCGTYLKASIKKACSEVEYEAFCEGEALPLEEIGGVSSVFGVSSVQGRDLHFPHQKAPLGLLSPDISKTERAKLLAQDPVSDRVMGMIAQYKDVYSGATRRLKESTAEIELIDDKLAKLREFSGVAELRETLKQKCLSLKSAVDSANKGRALVVRYEKLSGVRGANDILSKMNKKETKLSAIASGMSNLECFIDAVSLREEYRKVKRLALRGLLKKGCELELDDGLAEAFERSERFFELEILEQQPSLFETKERLRKQPVNESLIGGKECGYLKLIPLAGFSESNPGWGSKIKRVDVQDGFCSYDQLERYSHLLASISEREKIRDLELKNNLAKLDEMAFVKANKYLHLLESQKRASELKRDHDWNTCPTCNQTIKDKAVLARVMGEFENGHH